MRKSGDIIKEIAIYLGETELLCKHCGTITHVNDVKIETRLGNSEKHIATYHAVCPDCDGYIKKMRQDKKNRVFWKGSMINIGEFSSGMLLWILQVEYCKSERVNEAIGQLLWDRTEIKNIKDINPTIKEMNIAEYHKTLSAEEKELKERETRVRDITAEIVSGTTGWNFAEMQKQEKILKALQSSLKTRGKRIGELKDTLDKLYQKRRKG